LGIVSEEKHEIAIQKQRIFPATVHLSPAKPYQFLQIPGAGQMKRIRSKSRFRPDAGLLLL
jgi:hypothetical protein